MFLLEFMVGIRARGCRVLLPSLGGLVSDPNRFSLQKKSWTKKQKPWQHTRVGEDSQLSS